MNYIEYKKLSSTDKRKYKESLLTLDFLKSILNYDPITGIWTWLIQMKYGARKEIGDIAGRRSSNNYIQITINGWHYYAHRLAVFYMTNKWPENEVDHKNHNGSNNAWSNLREAIKLQNNKNVNKYKDGRSKYKGVSFHNLTNKCRARIYVNSQEIHLGFFEKELEAAKAYDKAAIKYFGEFAHTNFPKENYL
jgi:hypothetical protein